nr:hypothetical protein [Tanacetum cinerariifolium]
MPLVHEEDSDDDFETPVSYQSKQVAGNNDEAIDADEEDSEDDFEAVRYPMKQASSGNDTPVKWTKRMILARSPDSTNAIK